MPPVIAARRVTKIEEALSPTQLLVRWLTQAQQEYAFFSEYAAYVNATALANPMLWLPEQVASWVRSRTSDRREQVVNQEIDRLVTATLSCVALVRQVNHTLRDGHHGDQIELDLLEAMAPAVASGTADATVMDRWTEHVRRLLHETLTWELAITHIGDRYFAGRSPLFASETAQLARTRNRCETLVQSFMLSRPPERGRGKRREHSPTIDRVAIAREAEAALPDLVAQLRSAARLEVELVFTARPGLLYVQQRIAATRVPDGEAS
jgi:hypothetical protein